ncbi:MAG TPA: ABC transporter permease [Methylomirabilota bacterium]|nr:ABC transporter permease [Methylomirabilota bacterium]
MARPAHATVLERATHVGVRALSVLVLGYLVLPIVVVLPLSFTSGELLVYPLPAWSLRWYREFTTAPDWTRALWNSTVLAVVTTVVATAVGLLAALGLQSLRSRLKPALYGLLALPLVIPHVMVAVALFYYYARLGLVGSFAGLVMAHTVLALPFVIITIAATLQGFDVNLPRAAASLGASPLQTFRMVTLPLILPGVISGAVFAFVTSFDELLVILFVGSPEQRTLPRQIWSGVSETMSPAVVAAAVVLIGVSLLLMAVVELLRRRGERLRGATRP